MRRLDVLVTAVIVGACAFAVSKMAGSDPLEPYSGTPAVKPLEIGQAVEDVVLTDFTGEKRHLVGWLGTKATVLYAWSVACPCVDVCEERVRSLLVEYREKYGKPGVVWIGVAGDPADTAETVLDKMGRLGAAYKMLLDPSHKLCRRVGLREATHVAVLDADGYLRYRGTIDDDLKDPKRSFLAEALAAVTEGRPPAVSEHEVEGYGCAFGAPIEDCPAGSP